MDFTKVNFSKVDFTKVPIKIHRISDNYPIIHQMMDRSFSKVDFAKVSFTKVDFTKVHS